jgi:hypothetical protein
MEDCRWRQQSSSLLTVDLVAVQVELLAEDVEIADRDIDAEEMVSLVEVLHRDVEADFTRGFVGDVAVALHAEAVVDVHRDLVANQTISGGKLNETSSEFFDFPLT